jgi:hypothetical protein
MRNTVQQTPDVNAGEGAGGIVDFRRATVERAEILPAETNAMTAVAQRIERTVEGSGYVFGIMLDLQAVTAANVAAVAFLEDAPWSALDTVVYRDVNGELINLSGFELFLANLGGKQYAGRFLDGSALFRTVPGAAATGGSFDALLRVPVALNRRSLAGLVGNQDASQKYSLRTDLAASGQIYGTAPTNLPGAGGNGSYTLNKQYENYAVPLKQGPDGQAQERAPRDFGLLHYLTSIQSAETPAPSSTVGHFLKRVGLSIRFVCFVFRAGVGATPRAVAQANAPTNLRLKIGDAVLFNEPYRYRRALMFERYGFDWPDGVIIYDAIHDFLAGAGSEVGDDYYQTQGLVNSQLQVAYPAGFTAGGSLRILTDDLAFVAPVAA